MKIAVSSKGAGLGAWLEPDLNRCGFLMIVDEKYKFYAIENNGNIIEMLQEAVEKGIEAVVAGCFSDAAMDFLHGKEIKIFIAQQGSILDLVEKCGEGKLKTL